MCVLAGEDCLTRAEGVMSTCVASSGPVDLSAGDAVHVVLGSGHVRHVAGVCAGLFSPFVIITFIDTESTILPLSPASWLDAPARACARRVWLGSHGGSVDGAL